MHTTELLIWALQLILSAAFLTRFIGSSRKV